MKEYIIKKGQHYSKHLPKLYLGDKKDFKIKVEFTESCRYNLSNINQLDVNKLFGVSFGYHKHNSIRIGWNYNIDTDMIDIYRYEYNNGRRLIEKIYSVHIYEELFIKLNLTEIGYVISIESEFSKFGYIVEEYIFNYPNIKLGYYLYPYFGGDEVAPHKIIVKMCILYVI